MTFELKYFTGTGNSLKILNTCKDVFLAHNHSVNISPIQAGQQIDDADIVGFCFPVYAFGIPRLAARYLKSLRKFKSGQKAFIIITAGDADESGYSVLQAQKLLRRKKCDIIYSHVIEMPINWTTSPKPPFPPTKEEAAEIVAKGVPEAEKLALDILNGVTKFHTFNVAQRYGRFGMYREYLLFKYLGLTNMWRTFKTYDSCNGCSLCSKVCPTGSIRIVNKKPVWASTCEQCMRCVNFCPKEAIYQTFGGDTKGKNRYMEVDFDPLKR